MLRETIKGLATTYDYSSNATKWSLLKNREVHEADQYAKSHMHDKPQGCYNTEVLAIKISHMREEHSRAIYQHHLVDNQFVKEKVVISIERTTTSSSH